MKILLLSLLPTTENFGIKYLHSYVLQQGHQSAILFIPRHEAAVMPPLKAFIDSFRPDLIGCGMMSYEAPFAASIGRQIKEHAPRIPLMVGGIHPTVAPEECLEYADMVSIGESEDTVLETLNHVADGKSLQEIQNLAFKDGHTVRKNPLRPLIADLDRLPFPGHFPEHSHVYHKGKILPMDVKLFRKYTRYDGKAYNIISSRGCPFSCSYCCNSFLSKLYGTKSIRKRSPQNVVAELRSAVEAFPDIILVNIHDDCFLAHREEWHREFVKDYKKWIDRPFIVRSTPLHLTEEKIRMLKEAGLAWVTMGLQSGSERTNREVYGRHVSNRKFLEATELAKKYSVSGYYDVILDNPFEAEEDVISTIKVLREIPKPFQLQLFTLTFYKGTDIYGMMQKKMGDGTELPIQNYFSYKPSFLNKLVRISPLIPSALVDYFIRTRKEPLARLALSLLHVFIVTLIEPFSYFYLMLKGFNRRLLLTLRIAFPTFKTKIGERLMSLGRGSHTDY
jgi:anaerobic magnesium-protoporphyrin IX monomethyl ester cyclase